MICDGFRFWFLGEGVSMSFFVIVLFGVIQGITEFLPISSFAHLFLAGRLLGAGEGENLLWVCMFHLGTALAILATFRKDFGKIALAALDMGLDLIHNIYIYLHNRRSVEVTLPYTRIIVGAYRKLAALLLLSTACTFMIGFSARRLVALSTQSVLIPGGCTLISGIFLLVADLGRPEEEKSLKESGFDSAMWMGICQGLSVFPGLSRSALTICAGEFTGLGRKFAVKLSYMMSVPVVFGAFWLEALLKPADISASGMLPSLIGAVFFSFLFGMLVIRFMLRLLGTVKFRYFALYSIVIGVIILLM